MSITGFRGLAVVGMAVVAASTVFASAPAQAATGGSARVLDNRVHFEAAQGHANNIVVTRSGQSITIDDIVPVRGTAGCVQVGKDKTKVTCTSSRGLTQAYLSLGNKNDVLTNKSSIILDVWAGSGNDKVVGGTRSDVLRGETGNDALYGGRGNDTLVDGRGNDLLDGGAGEDILNSGLGADRIFGGAGDGDSIYYGSRTKPLWADLDGAKGDDGERGEGDTLGADVEVLIGGSGNDTLNGNARANHIVGGRGNDMIRGLGGNDLLVGNNGDDHIYGNTGNDVLIGENTDDRHPDGTPANSDTAKDQLDGGESTPNWGDFCMANRAGTYRNCELFENK